jgi:recombination protein RecA
MAPRKKEEQTQATPNASKIQDAASKVAEFKAVMNKVFKETGGLEQVDINEDSFKQSLPHFSSGSIVIDYLIGGKPNRFGVLPCPGYPRGKVINLYGQESSGKTTLALTAAKSILDAGGSVLYIDWEYAIVPSYAKAIGVNVDDDTRFVLSQPSTLETGLGIIWGGIKKGFDLIVIDSVGAAVPKAYLEQGIDEKGDNVRIGLVSQKWSKVLPELVSQAAKSNTCILGISQLRSKINTSGYGQGDGSTQQGGNAWRFYSALRIGLARIQQEYGEQYSALTHSKEKMVIGSQIKIRLDKCKIASSQGQDAKFYLKHGEGIDDVRSVIEIASHHGIIKKSGAWLTWEGQAGEIRAQGKDDFKKQMFALNGASAEIYKSLFQKMGAIDSGQVPTPVVDAEAEDMAEINRILEGNTAKVETVVTGENNGGMIEEG